MSESYDREVAIVAQHLNAAPYNAHVDIEKAIKICVDGRVREEDDGTYLVVGENGNYTVTIEPSGLAHKPHGCTCEYAKHHPGDWCKHKVAVEMHRRALAGLKPLAQPAPSNNEKAAKMAEEWYDNVSQGLTGRTLEAILRDLRQRWPEEVIGVRKQAGQDIRYLHWHTLCEILDQYAPGWESEIVRERLDGSDATVVVRLTIRGSDCTKSWESLGTDGERYNKEGEAIDGYGSPLERAERSAFRRACAMAGLGRYLYDKGKDGTGKALKGLFTAQRSELLRKIAEKVGGEKKQSWLAQALADTGAKGTGELPIWYLESEASRLGA